MDVSVARSSSVTSPPPDSPASRLCHGLAALCFATSAEISATTLAGDGGTTGKRVIGYFTQWGIYGRNYRVKNIDSSGSAARLTHINYAFGNVRNNRCEVGITQPSDPNSGAGGDACN